MKRSVRVVKSMVSPQRAHAPYLLVLLKMVMQLMSETEAFAPEPHAALGYLGHCVMQIINSLKPGAKCRCSVGM